MRYAVTCPYSNSYCDSRCNHHNNPNPPPKCVRAVAMRKVEKLMKADGYDTSGLRADMLDGIFAGKEIEPD